MTDHKNHLSRAYGLDGVDATQKFYSDWAATYDAEVLENGYATPKRCAKALAHCVQTKDLSILDIGCGTGLSGKFLSEAGFTQIDGCDINPDMLEIAKVREIYRQLWRSDLNDPFPFDTGMYDVIAAIGVIGSGAAPVEVFYDMMKKLGSGGFAVFSFNDHTLTHPEFEAAAANHIDTGAFELLLKEYGPHLPGKNMHSNVYVMRKQ